MVNKMAGQKKDKPNKPINTRGLAKRSSRILPTPSSVSDRRTELLDISARLFSEFGFESTSVRQIADLANLLPGSLYHHFATKEDILHEIIRAPLLESAKDSLRISNFPVDAEKRLVANSIMRFTRYIHDGQAHSIIQNDGKFFRRREDFSYVEEAKSTAFHIQESILKEGMATGLFHQGIDTYLMIGTFARMLSSAAAWFCSGDIHSSDKPEQYTFDRVLDFHLDCILRLIRPASRLSAPIPREECQALALSPQPQEA